MPSWPTKEEVRARARRWVSERWSSGCPVCASNEVTVGDEVVVALPIKDGALRPLETFVGHPFVQIICGHCGFMAHVSSSVLGLTPGSTEVSIAES